ncbi:MAG TPA: hypothetical protein VNO35_03215 [Steroidobacteraceae bacterium]|nr:hypothetical protein [Steroidobacteraceae bacterium]
MKELIVALDLELNQPSRRVVQIGAVTQYIQDVSCAARGVHEKRILACTG